MEPKLITRVYSRAVGALLLAFVVALLLVSSSMPSVMAAYSGNATYINYQPEGANWEWTSVENCAELNSDVPLAFRQRHRWTEFCGDLGPYRGNAGCHMCLQVSNAATDDGASVTVRIIDICNFNSDEDPVVWMDKVAFDQIDTDDQVGATNALGMRELRVNYEIANCGDEE